MLDHSARVKLLDEIQKRPFLYDREDPHYQDKELRQNAWKEIAGKFKKYNDNALQDAWFSLRKCYRRCVYGYLKRGTKPVWPLYGPMSFLERHVISTSKELKKIKESKEGASTVVSQISTPKSSTDYVLGSNGEDKQPDESMEEHAPMDTDDANVDINVGGTALLEALLELKQRATEAAEDSDISTSHSPSHVTTTEQRTLQNDSSEACPETVTVNSAHIPSTSNQASQCQKPVHQICAPFCQSALTAAVTAADDAEMAFGRHVAICLRKMTAERKCRAMTAIIEALHRDDPPPSTPEVKSAVSEF